VTFYENRTTFSSSQGQYFWLGSHAFSIGFHRVQNSWDSHLMNTKHKHIPVKSYYHRAKVFGYLALTIVSWLLIMYLIERFTK
jgi:hypothetical protein